MTARISRRRAFGILAVSGAAGLAWRAGAGGLGSAQITQRSRVLMGTVLNLTIVGDDPEDCERAADSALERMKDLESRLTRHRDNSEVGRLNQHGFLDHPSGDLVAVLRSAQDLSLLTDGAFDITIKPVQDLYSLATESQRMPDREQLAEVLTLVDHRAVQFSDLRVEFARPGMAITLDGIGKGYVIDRGVEALKNQGFDDVVVEVGGDLFAAGQREAERAWRVGIRHPRSRQGYLGRISITGRAMATSGDYLQPYSPDLRHHHILDPRTGMSPPELASCTVLAPDTMLADGLATAAMVLDPERSLELLEGMDGCEGVLVNKDMREFRTTGV